MQSHSAGYCVLRRLQSQTLATDHAEGATLDVQCTLDHSLRCLNSHVDVAMARDRAACPAVTGWLFTGSATARSGAAERRGAASPDGRRRLLCVLGGGMWRQGGAASSSRRHAAVQHRPPLETPCHYTLRTGRRTCSFMRQNTSNTSSTRTTTTTMTTMDIETVSRQTAEIVQFLCQDGLRCTPCIETDGPDTDDSFDPAPIANKLREVADKLQKDKEFQEAVRQLKQVQQEQAVINAVFREAVVSVCQPPTVPEVAMEIQMIKVAVALCLYVKRQAPNLCNCIQEATAHFLDRQVGHFVAQQGGWDVVADM
ncbi:hypothetical protein N1851_023247 [Merluccius polli]|uniref:Bcl-2 Bcl-2 homology region 1-3 domain-containing protein n=1 Tax=Merluccius polli TaxID=89951 RepID=A0AA47NXR6_MERPO|nr:hypothetical protein N1851_023247 [Merluccius polli]